MMLVMNKKNNVRCITAYVLFHGNNHSYHPIVTKVDLTDTSTRKEEASSCAC